MNTSKSYYQRVNTGTRVQFKSIFNIILENYKGLQEYLLSKLNKEFGEYTFKNKKNIKYKNWYINIKIKKVGNIEFDGKSSTEQNGDIVIEFIKQRSIRGTYQPSNDSNKRSNFLYNHREEYNDVHITLHKHTESKDKFHFVFKKNKQGKVVSGMSIKNNGSIMLRNRDSYSSYNSLDIIKFKKIIINAISYFVSNVGISKEVSNNSINTMKQELNKIIENEPVNTLEPPLISDFNEEIEKLEENENLVENEENENPLKRSRISGGRKKINYKDLTKEELVKICKINKINKYSSLNKDEMIKLIKKNK